MANLNRLRLLEQFAKEEPENPFNWYALALETESIDPERCLFFHRKVLKDFPDYLACYFSAAHFFAEQELLEEAKQTFEKGIDLAKEQEESKSLRELQNAYQNFLFENDMD